VKIAPIVTELRTRPEAITTLIDTAQHYDGPMSDAFFANLELPDPDVNLRVQASSATAQIAEIMLRLEPVLAGARPDLVVVVGDVNSTLAGALTASKLGLRLAHVEAGLRSFDRTMPEEINRVLTDSISDLLFTTEPAANENLAREGIPGDHVHHVGNVMIDTLFRYPNGPARPRSSMRSRSRPEAIACSPCTGPAMSTRRSAPPPPRGYRADPAGESRRLPGASAHAGAPGAPHRQ
jgi:UDP-N-acetylglucosamine 2-epimerase (non-hydrolysing)